jgi:heme exporter protein A
MADRGITSTLSNLVPVPVSAGASDREPALKLEGLVRRYGEREALSDVSLSLHAGQTLVVFGPNGAGKTTLLRVLATLLRPHAGDVRVLGARLPDEAWAVRGRVGLLGHEPLLYRELTVRENLLFHARLHGVGEERVEELLGAVALADRADEPLKTLSRGMVQRAAVARATLHDPELLLLDEPWANLDPAARELVEPLIGASVGIGRTSGPGRADGLRARVISSHDPDGGLREADLVLGLRDGRAALLREAGDVDREEIAELYR